MSATLLADRYRLDRCIAIGGMGEVWRGWDLNLSRTVAIKVLRDCYSQDSAAVARFEAEARCARRLGHPGVVRIEDFGRDDRPFLVMELVDGSSLAQVLVHGPLGLRQTLDVIAQAADALHAAHRAGIVHRDIKPANLLIGPGGEVKLTDFGVAHSGDADAAGLASAGIVMGTAAYLAPELVVGEPATVASDLYSLGVVMFECLTGARPFTGSMMEVALAHHLLELPALPTAIPSRVRSLAGRLTSKDSRARPGSAAMVRAEAVALRDQLGGTTRGHGWLEQRKRKRARRLPAAVTLVDCPVG